ncbi:phosphatidylserine/phosphatidylglycerophosphate/cardiolipin synthase family protein [Micromonospora sp. NPDC047740]|uniref:phospholipase D-like domain-containing protein n=1 Tax=Micromonospora sp. NPDC047740 TaxID=3364254 RepID=UPI003717BB8C
MNLRRRLLAAALALPLLAVAPGTPGVAAPGAGSAASAPDLTDDLTVTATFPAYTRFNVPAEDGTRDRAIEDEIVALADGVPAGSYIRGAMYSWTSPVVADALARAAARGVVVRVVVDREGEGNVNLDPANAAIQKLRAANLDDLVFCGSSSASVAGSSACIANHSNSINHNKFFTFSTSGTMKRVVLISSQNLTFSQNNLFNNAVVVHEDYDLYDHFTRYFNKMRAQQKNNDFYADADGYYKSPDTGVTVYHSPRASGDTVANVLSYVTKYESGCSVEVAQASFTNPRTAVASELLRIARLGCQVRVVYGAMGDQVHSILRGSANVQLKKYWDAESSNYDGRVVTVHSKYLVVKGSYNGTAGRTIVFTGSHNLTGPSLRDHDETFVKIENPTVSADYRANFATLWSRAKCVNPDNGSCSY